MENSNNNKSRRNFIKTAAAGGAALGLAPISHVFGSQTNTGDQLQTSEYKIPVSTGKSVMGLRCEPLKTVRIGLIGLGMRGSGSLGRLLQVEGAEIVAIADVVPKAVKDANKQITDAGLKPALEFTGEEDWKKICERDDIDLVYQCTPWLLHTPVSVYEMKHGQLAAWEVPS